MKTLRLVGTAALAVIAASPVRADLVEFRFTGTVTVGDVDPSWVGKSITGAVTFDDDRVEQLTTAPGSYFAQDIGMSDLALRVEVVNPDGSLFVSDFSFATGQAAREVFITDDKPLDQFWLQSLASDRFSTRAQRFSLYLEAWTAPSSLLRSANPFTVEFDLSQADFNLGVVWEYGKALAVNNYSYQFRVESIERVIPAVPEPSGASLLLAGLIAAAALACRRRG